MILVVGGAGVVTPACGSAGLDASSPAAGGTAGSANLMCEPGLTRTCVGPGACAGGQKCDISGTWTDCDCGETGAGAATGGSPSTGGVATGGVATGGAPSTIGGYAPVLTGGVGTGNVPVVVFGGYPAVAGGAPSGGRASGGLSYPSGGRATGGTATGGAATGGTPTDGGPSTVGSLDVTQAGYVQGDTYQGYAWTATENPSKGSTITPKDFSSVTTATQLCVSGSVAADAAYGGVAMLGINLNQSTEGGTGSELAYTPPSGGSVTVSVTNTGGSSLRVMIQSPNGSTDANQRWCASLSGSGGTIALSTFNTQCWQGGSGTAYGGQPLQSIMILVPGGNATATPFNFCLNALEI
jgi:hypothetical protein